MGYENVKFIDLNSKRKEAVREKIAQQADAIAQKRSQKRLELVDVLLPLLLATLNALLKTK